MWNVNMRRGAIWYTKSINQYEWENYRGMSLGPKLVFIINAFTNEFGKGRFTYFKLNTSDLFEDGNCIEVPINDRIYYMNIDEIYTGDQNALEEFVMKLSDEECEDVIIKARQYFNLSLKNKKSKLERQALKEKKDFDSNAAERIYKFGMYIHVIPNTDVTVTDSKKLILSKKAKQDIINSSNDDEDIKELCHKYKIYPAAAIRQLKSRLVYQNKQKHK